MVRKAESEAERERLRRIAQTPAESIDGRLRGARAPLRQRRGLPAAPPASPTTSSRAHARDFVTNAVLAIFGPTGSGKTAVAEALAERIPAEVVSADSMQLYRGLPILTAQPSRPTRLVAIWELDHQASLGEYQHLAHEAIDEILEAGKTPVVVGGRASTFELRSPTSTCLPRRPPGGASAGSRCTTTRAASVRTSCSPSVDPEAAAAVHPNDRRRVVRALELAESGASLRSGRNRLWTDETRHPTVVFGLDLPERSSTAASRRGRGRCSRRAREPRWSRALAGLRLGHGALAPWAWRSWRALRRRSRARGRWPAGRGATRRTSASGCGAFRALLA